MGQITGFIRSKLTDSDTDALRYYAVKIFSGVFSFLFILAISRLSGPETFGKISISLTLVNWSTALSCTWLTQSILRFLNNKGKGDYLENNLKRLRTICAGISAIVTFIVSLSFNISNLERLEISALSLIWAYTTIGISYNQSKHRTYLVGISETLRFAIPAICIFSIHQVMEEATDTKILAAIIIGYCISYIPVRLKVTNSAEAPRTKKTINATTFLNYGFPICLWMSTAILFNLYAKYFYSINFNSTTQGIFSVYYDISIKVCTIALGPIIFASHPRIMNEANNGKGDFFKIVKRATKQLIAISSIIIAGAVIFKPLILKTLFSAQTDKLAIALFPLLILSIISECTLAIATVQQKTLEVKEKTKTMLLGMVYSFIIFAVLSYALLPNLNHIAIPGSLIISRLSYLGFVVHKSKQH